VPPQTPQTREQLVQQLVDGRHLFRLLDHYSCQFCGCPRQEKYHRGFSTCWGCEQNQRHYGDALSDLVPITYTTKKWSLGTAIRDFKDVNDASASVPTALYFGALLSLWLDEHIDTVVPEPRVVTSVPSSRPVIASALERAATEGWWVPDLVQVATRSPTATHQRTRREERWKVASDSWIVDSHAVAGLHVLVLDDICTSGGSLHSFARALLDHGALSVTGVVMARNLGDNDGVWARPLLDAQHEAGQPWDFREIKHEVIA